MATGTRTAVSVGALVVGAIAVALSAFADNDERAYVVSHGLVSAPYLLVGLVFTGRAIRAGPEQYRSFWQRWLAASIASGLAAVLGVAGVVWDSTTLLALDRACLTAAVPLTASAMIHLLRAEGGRRALSIDLLDAATAAAVVNAPVVLLVGGSFLDAAHPAWAVPFAFALLTLPAGLYLLGVNMTRVAKGQRTTLGIGAAFGAALMTSVALNLARALEGPTVPLPVLISGHVVTMSLGLAIPLWAHRHPTGRLIALPAERQVRLHNPMPMISAIALVALGPPVFALRSERPWGVTYLGAVALGMVVLSALRSRLLARETRGLYSEVERMAEERRGMLADMVRALEDDRHRTLAELHMQTVGSLAALGTISRSAWVMLPADVARTVDETVVGLRRDLTARAEHLRQLTAATRPPGLDGSGCPADRLGEDALATALRAYASELYRDPPTAAIDVAVDPQLELDRATMTVVYCVAREALLNAARHEGVTLVTVRVRGRDGGVVVEVGDDGAGCIPPDAEHGTGPATLELFARLGQGRIEITSTPGEGTTVRAFLGAASRDAGPPPDQEQSHHLRLVGAPRPAAGS